MGRVGDTSGDEQISAVRRKLKRAMKMVDEAYEELMDVRNNRAKIDDLVVEHDPAKTDCTKFLITIEDGEVIAYDGCHGDAQGVAHAKTLYGASPFKTNNGTQRHVMLSIDEVPPDEEGMSENERAARQMFDKMKTGS
jgi:hypothetical protein